MTATARMGRPSLGDRAIMTAPLPIAVLRTADAVAADHSTDRSAILSDIVCYHYDRPDLMRHLSQQVLFESRTAAREVTAEGRLIGPHVKVRPPREVADMVVADYQRRGITRPTLLADICCYLLGYPNLVRELNLGKEALPLAM
ncbi:hypothetical protein [Mycolicibacterium sphagni]|nr:hypothetical protein [Mycolicibacterium sphagni]